jgi:hypothetical protein
MEDILAIVFVLVAVALVVLSVRWFQRKTTERKEREYREMQEQIEATRKWRETQREKSLKHAVSNTPKAVEKPLYQESPSDLAYMREHNLITAKQHRDALAAQSKPSYAPSATQSVNQYQDNFMSDVAMGMVINSLMSSTHNSQSGTVTEDRNTGRVDVQVKESSWGFDDSDSRKSVSSSMDTSSSWSSSDSSSSSSSDSGPSSDW